MKTSVKNQSLDEIVFENRNKEYGAYALRITYKNRLTQALILALSILFLFFGSAFTYSKFFVASNSSLPDGIIITIMPPPNVEIKTPKKLKKGISKPNAVQKTIVSPIVKPVDNDVKVADLPPAKHDDIGTSLVSTKPTEGTEIGIEEGVPEILPPAPKAAIQPVDDTPVVFAEVAPEFPGGNKELYKFLGKNLNYPNLAVKSNVEGKVFLKFVIEKDGSIGGIQVIKGIGFNCDEEAIRVLKAMPKWSPGKQNGRTVRVYYTMPIVFKLN